VQELSRTFYNFLLPFLQEFAILTLSKGEGNHLFEKEAAKAATGAYFPGKQTAMWGEDP